MEFISMRCEQRNNVEKNYEQVYWRDCIIVAHGVSHEKLKFIQNLASYPE